MRATATPDAMASRTARPLVIGAGCVSVTAGPRLEGEEDIIGQVEERFAVNLVTDGGQQ